MTLHHFSQPLRFTGLIAITMVMGLWMSADLAHREEKSLIAVIKPDSTGVSALLAERLATTTDTRGLVALGYRLAAADQCDLAVPVFNRAQDLSAIYRDANLMAGWCHLKIAQKSPDAGVQAAELAAAEKLVSAGQTIDPLNQFGRDLATTLASMSKNQP